MYGYRGTIEPLDWKEGGAFTSKQGKKRAFSNLRNLGEPEASGCRKRETVDHLTVPPFFPVLVTILASARLMGLLPRCSPPTSPENRWHATIWLRHPQRPKVSGDYE